MTPNTPNPTLPHPPFYNIPNIANLRDAALLPPSGLPVSTGGSIRRGILFRSAEPSNLDKSGFQSLKDLGIGQVFDLRSKPEIVKGWKGVTARGGEEQREEISKADRDVGNEEASGADDDALPWVEDLECIGINRAWIPVFQESDYSPERLAERYSGYMDEKEEGFVKAYYDILIHAGPAFREILSYLANLGLPEEEHGSGSGSESRSGSQKGQGVLIHCTAGKDRTGIFFGILFLYLGVPTALIAEEYNLTECGLAHLKEKIVDKIAQGVVERRREIDDVVMMSEEDEWKRGRDAALRMVGARKESMLGALEMVGREWGGAEGYLRGVVGLGGEELRALRRVLVVDGCG